MESIEISHFCRASKRDYGNLWWRMPINQISSVLTRFFFFSFLFHQGSGCIYLRRNCVELHGLARRRVSLVTRFYKIDSTKTIVWLMSFSIRFKFHFQQTLRIQIRKIVRNLNLSIARSHHWVKWKTICKFLSNVDVFLNGFLFYSILAEWSTWPWVFLNFSQTFWFFDTPVTPVIWNHC